MRKEIYLETGGFDSETFPTSYNDVDLCLKVRKLGYDVLQVGGARLIHHESATRKIGTEENLYLALLMERWGDLARTEKYSCFTMRGAGSPAVEPSSMLKVG